MPLDPALVDLIAALVAAQPERTGGNRVGELQRGRGPAVGD